MSESTFNADLDALVRGEPVSSNDELTRFVSDVFGEEQNMMMPNSLKLRIANDLGLDAATEPTVISAPVSRRTLRAGAPQRRSSRPWAIAFAVAAAILLALTGVLRWGMPTSDNEPDNQFLFSSPAVPTVAATPETTPDSDNSWLQPITAEECPEDELMDRGAWIALMEEKATNRDEADTRLDQPYSPMDAEEAEQAAMRQRQAIACLNSEDSDALPIESPQRSWEWQTDPETNQAIQVDRIERSKDLSSWVEQEMGLTPVDLIYPTEIEPGPVWPPSQAIEMGDGRIALIPGWLATGQETPTSFEFFVPVWTEIDGEWLLDEELFFCIGECDDFWSQLESGVSDLSTPVASPEASEGYDASWMLPVEADGCVTDAALVEVDAQPQEFDAVPRRESNVVGPANTADALAANQTARQSQACDDPTSLWSTRLASDSSLAGEEFSPFTIVLLHQQWEDGQVVSEALETNGMQPTDFTLVAGGDNPMFTDVEDGTYLISNPYMALALEDGRIIIPWVEIKVSKSEMSGSRIVSPYIGTALVLTEEEGAWKVDGQLPICVGECERVWSQLNEIIMDALYLSPIAPEECDANAYLPTDLTEEEAAVVRSRQYVACETSGDSAPLQGPDFRVTDGEDARALSDEIESLHRQNGETPGSLQRIARDGLWPEVAELPGEPWTVFQPGSVVTLKDGRVAALETTVVTPDIVAGSGRTSPVITTALVWIVDGDTWQLDEEITVCLGNCDSFWGVEATPEVATPEATEIAMVIPETCAEGDEFVATFASHDRLPIQLRPEPIMQAGVYLEVLKPRAPLQYLCESEPTTNPALDSMDEGRVWLLIRTEDGTEGWIRENDVREIEP